MQHPQNKNREEQDADKKQTKHELLLLSGHSTEDALMLMVNRILASRDRRMFTGVVLLDMSKAFDKVRHQQLVEDLFCVGVTGTALQWLM